MSRIVITLFVYCVTCLISFISNVNGALYTGDRCIAARTGGAGICKAIVNCPKAIDDIKNRRGYPANCGYEGYTQIICCPLDVILTTPAPTPPPANARISIKKCYEYKRYTYANETTFNTVTNMNLVKEQLKCPFVSVPLIIGGKPAELKEFPHMALIGYQGLDGKIKWGCGGTLISDEFVLTAAHCGSSRDFGRASHIRLGELKLNDEKDGAKPIDVQVAELINNPNYTSASQYNDIALIRMKTKVSLNEFIRPACLPTTYDTGTKRAIATGWGTIEWSGATSDALLKVTLEIFTHAECNQSYADDINRRLKYGIVDETQLCAGSHTEEKDTCQGDSGGPLQIYHPSEPCMYTVVGVTSFGKVCGTISLPGVYTRVYSYLDWIESIVWPNI